MKYAEFDLSMLPIVYVIINPVDVTINDYRTQVLDVQTKILRDHPTTYWVFNSKHTKLLSSEHRIAAGTWMKDNLEMIKERVPVVILTECSFWTQMMIKSIFLVVKPPVPFEMCSDLTAAKKLIDDRFKKKA
jgi:hypothetical protein